MDYVLQGILERRYEARLCKNAVLRKVDYDTEMDRILTLVGENICSLIYEEYVLQSL